MFFRDKVHTTDVVKWGIIAGLFEGLYIGLAAVFFSQQPRFASLSGWDVSFSFFLTLFVAASAIATTIIVFAHPIFSLLRKQYRDAIATLAVTLVTLVAVYGFVAFTYKQLF